MSESLEPELSVVVAWQESQPDIEPCLQSLFKQTTARTFEVIVASGGFEPPGQNLAEKYPLLKLVRHPESGSIPSLHGLGIRHSSGKLVAITEAHTTFAADWIDTAVSISEACGDAAIGGAVEPGRNLSDVDYALYICDYAQFALPLETGSSDDLPGNNIIFKREVIDKYCAGRDLEKDGFWKTFFCNELIEKGEHLSRDGRLVAFYNRHLSFTEVMERRYHHGRCFGAMRSSQFSGLKRAFFAASCAALPPVLLMRLHEKVRTKPSLRPRFLKVQQFCLAIVSAWVRGEFAGTVSGAGDSCSRL